MMGALSAGVSGVQSHQTRMTVLGNNLANVNTLGFKYGRMNFQTLLSQTMANGSGAQEGRAATNPVQLGMGTTIGSVDTVFSQGTLESTGRETDLALQGEGFFVLSDGTQQCYTRTGSFAYDTFGRLIDPANGYVLQGWTASQDGSIDTVSPIGDIALSMSQQIEAKATESMVLQGNLDADSQSRAQAWSGTLAQRATINGGVLALPAAIVDGDNDIIVTVDDSGGGSTNDTIELIPRIYASAEDLINEINIQIANSPNLNGQVQAVLNATGDGIDFRTIGTGRELTLAGDALVPMNVTAGSQDDTIATTTNLNALPIVTTALIDGDVINISGTNPDGTDVAVSFTYGAAASGTDVQDLMDTINTAFAGVSATLDESGNIVLADVQKGNSATTISLSLAESNTGQASLPNFLESVQGRDVITHTTSITAYDGLGDTHTVTVTFAPTDTAHEWTWTATVSEGTINTGGTGTATFNPDGSLQDFYNGNITFTPDNGASEVSISLDAGTGLDGLTQFNAASDAMATNQDGYSSGALEMVNIREDGAIEGLFSNGVIRNLAQLAVADFENPNGLQTMGGNVYQISASSGQPRVGRAGREVDVSVQSGSLEMSNVDMAQQLTEMILVQRGIQANIRSITTADSILGELVNIRR